MSNNLVSLDPGMMIWVWVTFGVLFILLKKFAWGPILNAIESRENYVRETLEKANGANEEAQQLLEKHQKMMREANEEVKKILDESRQLGEKAREEVLQKARNEADALLQRAQKEIENQKVAALKEMRAMVADLSVKITEQILKEKIDAKKQESLIDQFIDEISNQN
jgi:F-type H+-transporting ATPase subunit b